MILFKTFCNRNIMKYYFQSFTGWLFIFIIAMGISCKKQEVPIVVTSAVTNINITTAKCGGTITDEGSGTVTERGVCWSTNITPSISDNLTTDGGGAGSYVSEITNLDPAKTYYVRAYAQNEAGLGYGMAVSFSTKGQVPNVLTKEATNISANSVTLNGTINANYLSTTVTFEYGATSSYGNIVVIIQNPVNGDSEVNISTEINSLLPGETYHFRVKAVNSLGTTLGNDMVFTTLGGAPLAITEVANFIGTSAATLNAIINANYFSTTVCFEYGLTDAYGVSVEAEPSPVSGNTAVDVSANITGLQLGHTYHFRIKALNQKGTSYGNDFTFTTASIPNPPGVTTSVFNPTSSTTGTGGGHVTDEGATRVTDRGLCWSLTSNPTILDSKESNGTGIGSFDTFLSGLSPNTLYHVRAYATNSDGTAYGADIEFTTDPLTVNDVDGNTYDVIRIGTQLWMAENLKTTRLNNGTPIVLTENDGNWSSNTQAGYCWYGNNLTNGIIYGALYNWHAVNTGILCPSGYHVATDNDWLALNDFLGGGLTAGGKLKETGSAHWAMPNVGATNDYGFTGLPGGWRTDTGSYEGLNTIGYWWASIWDTSASWYRHILNNSERLFRVYTNHNFGMSVRCVKDN